jgi:signal transduction histidine kinase
MSELIKAVLNYSRLSRTTNEFTEVDLNTIINNLKIDLELLIEEKKAIIKCDRLPIVSGNPLQLNQLFLNLFSNSLKFTERNPEIEISSSFIAAGQATIAGFAHNGNAYLEIVFKDNGIGFEPHYSEQVFSIFQRLHATDKYAGTGIGLALCKKIVENHNGQILVKSQPGAGTSFFIYLPLTHAEKAQASQSNVITNREQLR